MKTLSDYIQQIQESEAAVNTVSSGAIANKDVPLGKVQKRKVDESNAYEGDNPLADNIGKFPLTDVGAESAKLAQAIEDEQSSRRFHQKQQYQNDQCSS